MPFEIYKPLCELDVGRHVQRGREEVLPWLLEEEEDNPRG
jgi:hypothetical protein